MSSGKVEQGLRRRDVRVCSKAFKQPARGGRDMHMHDNVPHPVIGQNSGMAQVAICCLESALHSALHVCRTAQNGFTRTGVEHPMPQVVLLSAVAAAPSAVPLSAPISFCFGVAAVLGTAALLPAAGCCCCADGCWAAPFAGATAAEGPVAVGLPEAPPAAAVAEAARTAFAATPGVAAGRAPALPAPETGSNSTLNLPCGSLGVRLTWLPYTCDTSMLVESTCI